MCQLLLAGILTETAGAYVRVRVRMRVLRLLVELYLEGPACTFLCICAHMDLCSVHAGILMCAHGTIYERGHRAGMSMEVGTHVQFLSFLHVHGCVWRFGVALTVSVYECVLAETQQGEGLIAAGAGSQQPMIQSGSSQAPPGAS